MYPQPPYPKIISFAHLILNYQRSWFELQIKLWNKIKTDQKVTCTSTGGGARAGGGLATVYLPFKIRNGVGDTFQGFVSLSLLVSFVVWGYFLKSFWMPGIHIPTVLSYQSTITICSWRRHSTSSVSAKSSSSFECTRAMWRAKNWDFSPLKLRIEKIKFFVIGLLTRF